MQVENKEYPIRKKDNLGRLIYVDWNGVERSVYRYWNGTKKVKIKYRLFHEETALDIYDKSGKSIMSYSSGIFEISLPRVWSNQYGDMQFITEKSILKKWRNIFKRKSKSFLNSIN